MGRSTDPWRRAYIRSDDAELLKTPLRVYYVEGIALQGARALPASKRVSSRHRPGVGRPFFLRSPRVRGMVMRPVSPITVCPDCQGTKEISIQVLCTACKGTGDYIPEIQKKCRRCKGSGEVRKEQSCRVCPVCKGSKIYMLPLKDLKKTCRACKGKGIRHQGATSCHRCKDGSLALNTLGQHWFLDKSTGGKIVQGISDIC